MGRDETCVAPRQSVAQLSPAMPNALLEWQCASPGSSGSGGESIASLLLWGRQ